MSGIGHLAAGFTAQPMSSKIPLLALLIASETNDLLYFVFSSVGLEPKVEMTMSFTEGISYSSATTNPFSHGLFMSVIWSLIAASIGYLIFRDRRTSFILGAVVFSHWVLDFLMHSNLPLFFNGSPTVGLGLENSGPGFLFMTLFDLVILGAGITYYFRSRKKLLARK